MYTYSFIPFEVVAHRLLVAFSRADRKKLFGPFHVTKHEWNLSSPNWQQLDASALMVRGSPKLPIIEIL